MNDVQKANVQRLITHYEANPPTGWQFNQCAAGVLGVSGLGGPDGTTLSVAILLGITREEAYALVYQGYSGTYNRRNYLVPAYKYIVPSLKKLLETGKFTWVEPKDVS